MECLIYPCYFPNIAHYKSMLQGASVIFEINAHYKKQTYLNRTDIYAANGKLSLSVPVNYTQKNRQVFKDVKIANQNNWQKQHLKSLQSAYSLSPFFEYYIDDLMPIFEKNYNYLLDVNMDTFEILNTLLNLSIKYTNTKQFLNPVFNKTIAKNLIEPKTAIKRLNIYTQVFSDKHGFIQNLSVLDVLFNQGPASEIYLSEVYTEQYF